MKRVTGTVTDMANRERGYGFITGEGSELPIFFHAKQVKEASFDELKEGTKVSYVFQQTVKGPRALMVEVVT